MAKYPLFLELQDRRVVVIGGGAVAGRKAEVLLSTGAKLVVVAEKISDGLRDICRGQKAELHEVKYSKEYFLDAILVIAATNDNDLNRQIYKDCRELGILCNVVDVPELCDFFVPAVVKRQDLQIAIGTDGRCPAYSGLLRKKLEKIFTDKHGQFLIELDLARKSIIEQVEHGPTRKALLERLVADESFEYFVQNGPAEWQSFAKRIILQRKK